MPSDPSPQRSPRTKKTKSSESASGTASRKKTAGIFPDGFWSSPKPQPGQMGDPFKGRIHRAVGRALSSWEESQERLVGIYTFFCQVFPQVNTSPTEARVLNWPERIPYDAAFHSLSRVESYAAKRTMIEAAAEVYYHRYWDYKAVKGALKEVMDEVQKASYIRNEIAHGIAVDPVVHSFGPGGSSRLKVGCFLVALSYATHRHRGYSDFYTTITEPGPVNLDVDLERSRYRYNSAQINEFSERFRMLRDAISDYAMRIRKPICLE